MEKQNKQKAFQLTLILMGSWLTLIFINAIL